MAQLRTEDARQAQAAGGYPPDGAGGGPQVQHPINIFHRYCHSGKGMPDAGGRRVPARRRRRPAGAITLRSSLHATRMLHAQRANLLRSSGSAACLQRRPATRDVLCHLPRRSRLSVCWQLHARTGLAVMTL